MHSFQNRTVSNHSKLTTVACIEASCRVQACVANANAVDTNHEFYITATISLDMLLLIRVAEEQGRKRARWSLPFGEARRTSASKIDPAIWSLGATTGGYPSAPLKTIFQEPQSHFWHSGFTASP